MTHCCSGKRGDTRTYLVFPTGFNCAVQTISYLVFHGRSLLSTLDMARRVIHGIQSISRMIINQGHICLNYSDAPMCNKSTKIIQKDQ